MARNRLLLIALAFWALLMIAPDLIRVVHPLGSLGLSVDNDGVVYDVTFPFAAETASPAWKAGVRPGDRLDLRKMRCVPYDEVTCGSVLTVMGGVQYLFPGRSVTLDLAAAREHAARKVTLVAEPRPANWLVRSVLVLDEIAGILVVIAAAWLVWTRPGGMSWGFFLYVIWFNPGQVYVYYALLQQWPPLLLVQDIASCLAQAAGYAGLLLFVLRVPTDTIDPSWRRVERALPWLALVLALALTASYAGAFGYGAEKTTRITFLIGFAVDIGALTILALRRKTQAPEDYQRLRWVIWGCLIGLPAFIVAEIGESTTLLRTPWKDLTPPEDMIGLLYLVNGILCLFVFEAVRRPRVVSVSIPLRRVTILSLMLSVPALLLHHEVDRIREFIDLPASAWFAVAAIALFLISRLHERATHLVNRYFNRALERAEVELCKAILQAREPAEIDRVLADGPFRMLALASAAAFRKTGTAFRRHDTGNGWDDRATRTLRPDDPMLAALPKHTPFSIAPHVKSEANLPGGLQRPILTVPAANRLRCFALALYGPHASGTDLDADERAMLARLGDHAADSYAQLETDELRERIRELENAQSTRKQGRRKPNAPTR
jgi:hypothetical protein